ncbi:uncharacterized protein LOC132201040 [Neocloeon triangulifer]|uniref:uncharacterized protein LOC132201040 n=1 Tax=Neocloeon triangulifer TaxID=2078957 RepID=UPI00286F7C33|nr:uncharacterized protein LOC132201040 [Neocloeon triangulifer]
MAPLILETPAEQECFEKYTLSAINWTLNFNYWTAGTQRGCAGQWSWCDPGNNYLSLGDNLKWEIGQPDNKGGKEDCVHLRILLNSTGTVLTDRNCTSKYIFLCEAKAANLQTPPCSKPTCPKFLERNTTLFNGNELNDFYSYGSWVSACGRNFLFSNVKKKFSEAWKACNAIGLTLLSLDSVEKNKCFTKMTNRYSQKVNDSDYWTSGTNSNCTEKFNWCSKDANFVDNQVLWKSGEPNLANGECVYVTIKNGTLERSPLGVAACNSQKYYVCEVRQRGTAQRGLEIECMALWDVSEADVQMLLLGYRNYTTRIKCFMKCIGEDKKLFVNGQLDPGDTLRLLELATQEEPEEMEKGFNGYVQCSSITGDDECVVAAKIYDCGVENLPNITQKMVDEGKGSPEELIPPVPCVPEMRSCVTESMPCIKDLALTNAFNNNKQTSIGTGVWMNSKNKTIFISYKMDLKSIDFAHQYCCSLGMRLIELPSRTEMEEFASLVPQNLIDSLRFLFSDVQQINDTAEVSCISKKLLTTDLYQHIYTYGEMPGMGCGPQIYYIDLIFTYRTPVIKLMKLDFDQFNGVMSGSFACA